MKKRLLSLLLSLSMLCTLLCVPASAEEDCVTVQILSELSDNAFDLGPYEVQYTPGMSAYDAVQSALDAESIAYEVSGSGESVYIQSINALAEYTEDSAYYGWMCAVDHVLPAVGIGAVALSGGEEILLYYSTDFTIPGTVSGSGSASSEGLSFSAGALTSSAAPGGTLLTLETALDSVTLTGVPGGESTSVSVNYLPYDLDNPTPIPLTDGGVITISVGDYPDTVYYNVNISLLSVSSILSTAAATLQGSSDPWAAVDLGACGLYAGGTSSAPDRQAIVDDAIAAATAQSLNDGALSKAYLGLRAMGIDPDRIVAADGTIVSVTDALMTSDTNSYYNAPYVLLALAQSGKATAEKMDAVLTVMESAAGDDFLFSYSWGGVTYPSPDTAGAVLAAVSFCAADSTDPYGITDRCAALRDGILNALSEDSLQSASGSFGNSCTDAMVLVGLCAAGVDPSSDPRYMTSSGATPYTALLSCARADGFGLTPGKDADSFSTEQCFRAIVAVSGLLSDGDCCNVYDFTSLDSEMAYATAASGCPVTFSTTPAGASVSLTGTDGTVEAISAGRYSLAEGTYTYTVSAGGYVSKTGSLTVSAAEAAAHTPRTVSVSLVREPSGGGGGSITVSFTLVGDSVHGTSSTHIYKNDRGSGRIWLTRRSVTLSSGSSAFDAFDTALTSAGLSYVEPSFNYISSITSSDGVTLSELDNGPLSGWQYLVNDTSPTTGCRNYTLHDGDDVVFYYTDDYTQEIGSEAWGGSTSTKPEKPDGSLPFTDVAEDASYAQAVKALWQAGYMNGTSADAFSPDDPLTRAQAVTVLYRMAGSPSIPDRTAFSDAEGWAADAVAWAVEAGVTTGCSDGAFHGSRAVTSQELERFLCRFLVWKGQCADETQAETYLSTSGVKVAGTTRGQAAVTFQALSEVK